LSGALPRPPERAVRALLTVLLLAAALPCLARDAVQAIDQCLGKLDPAVDVGYARIAERCPDLTAALSGTAWLPADWRRGDNQLSASGLADLRVLLVRESTRQPARAVNPSTEALRGVLAALTQESHTNEGWWSRFKQWLHRVMSTQQQADRAWLVRWLQGLELSQGWTALLSWGALAAVIVLCLWILAQELRAAGVFAARAPRHTAPASRHQTAGASPADSAVVAGREQPALLLQLIATVMAARALLPPARALTARELAQRAQLADPAARAQLLQLVEVCERIRFADEDVGEKARALALAGGRALLASIGAAAAGAPL
jgi:hypothetical protein